MSQEVSIQLKDGSVRRFAKGSTYLDVAADISPRLAKEAVAARANGLVVDLKREIEDGVEVELLTLKDSEGVDVMRHSCAHVMAQAVARLFPGTKFAIGPVIENGFYYDFADHDFTPEDLPRIEEEMKKIIAADYPIEREVISRDDALKMFREREDRFKVELIEDLPADTTITIYKQAEFVDLCRGPHLPSTGRIKVFQLQNIAGAYWRGDSKREMLTRLYAVAFAKKSELDEYNRLQEEARERDHRRLGKELDIFMLSPEVGQGLPLWLPNGAKIRRTIERYIVDLEESLGYDHVYTPHLASIELYKISGHWDHYHEDMYPPMEMDNEELVLRPMNCPHHMMVYKNRMHSYRELPIRIAELGMMHRYEMSGALAGLQRVRAMTLNDAHIFCRPDQIQTEFERVVKLIERVYKDFGIHDYYHRLSYRDPANTEKYVQNDEMWETAQTMLRQAMDNLGLDYVEAPGEAAFYGPKLDVQVRTALGKDETLSTVQLDFHLPNRFDLEYVGEDGKTHRPVVIHRGVVGTMERFTAFLIEQYKGAFPAWLAPTQAVVASVSSDYAAYAEEVAEKLREQGLRVHADTRPEKIGYKIREAQIHKIPYTLVVGQREAQEGTVSVRRYAVGDQGSMTQEAFARKLSDEVAAKELLVEA
ncbi:threonine--tRNA ligase [Alicyclobacillus acidoterrestris]|uniref:Threonine--tRNA ligase n=1 Tax=Alicyclobacillus acidoterrestris (strain ATCC 49025 / DSM 3922 / CIP 106132 / NCIMB 13137 / GD3B) TaxID=1356854 RepID=T0DP03_ALIAG|nr:threonine--tRNA ligase [Alicyclobacillus acidoterrestris]EPZ53092.1 threonyl-tRNA synthase [Alicyclobacillus acidoterrestris ATCC 49025]UNO48242.1 threonine--tRNA ligase [Alicyclobacillus acidoterrestris]